MRYLLPRLATQLAARGDELAVLGTARDLAAYDDVLHGVPRLTAKGADAPGASALWYLLRAGRVARRGSADVVLYPAATRRFTLSRSLPTVAVVHDLAQLHVPGKYDPLRMFYFRQIVLRVLRRATRLVAISGATRDDLTRALGISAQNIEVVPNGVDTARFRPLSSQSPEVQQAREHTDLHEPYLLYPARLEHPGKNHLRLLRAFSQSGVCRSHVMAFSGADWGARELIEAEISKLGLGSRVRLLGFAPEHMLAGLFAGADGIVMVGLCEGFGLPALEGLAAGRLVMASNTGALPEVVGPLGVLCDPRDEAALGQSLQTLIRDEALRDKARERGPAWAQARGWDQTAERLLQVCRGAAEGT